MLCITAVLVATLATATGPVGIAAKFRSQIAADDNVVFLGGYFFDVAVALDRHTPIYITGDWSRRADELPDNIRRQLTEGREFDAASGYVLIGQAGLRAILAQLKPVWVWGEKRTWAADPDLVGLTQVSAQGRFVLLRGGQ